MTNIANLNLNPNNTSQININKTNLSTSDIERSTPSETGIKSKQSSISSSNRTNKKKIFYIILFILLLIFIGSFVFIIIFFKGGKKEDLILENNKEENFVSRYFEIKTSTSYYDIEQYNETDIEQNNETNYNDTKNLNTTYIEQNMEVNYNDINKLKETYINKNNKTNNNNAERFNESKIIQKKCISTDFIVGINKKKNINENTLGENKYLYESYLLIINLSDINETDSVFLGGINVYNESIEFEQLIKINNELFSDILINKEKNDENSETINSTSYENKEVNIPFSKYSFFENGTLDKIYFPKYINEFYKSALIDLIEKVTPKLSKSIYNNETNKRRLEEEKEGTYLNYEIIKRNGNLSKIILYEETKIKDIDKNKDQYNFENSEMNSKIQRTFNPSGNMTNVKMEGDVSFIDLNNNNNNFRLIEEIDVKKNDTNNTYYNLGVKKFKMNVTSNMNLINNQIEKKTLEKLNILSKMINFELYDNLNTINNNSNNNSEELITSKINNSGPINFVNSYNVRYSIFDTRFLGMKLSLDQYLYINNNTGLRKGYINLILGSNEITLSEVEKYHYSNIEKGSDTKTLLDNYFTIPKTFKPFGFLFKIKFQLKVYLSHGVSFGIKDEEMYAKGFVNYDVGLSCTFSVDLFVLEFGVRIIGYIVKGNSYIEANTLLKIFPNWTKFIYSKQNFAISVDLNFYFSIWLLFWKKTYQKTINIYKGIPSSEYYYRFM